MSSPPFPCGSNFLNYNNGVKVPLVTKIHCRKPHKNICNGKKVMGGDGVASYFSATLYRYNNYF